MKKKVFGILAVFGVASLISYGISKATVSKAAVYKGSKDPNAKNSARDFARDYLFKLYPDIAKDELTRNQAIKIIKVSYTEIDGKEGLYVEYMIASHMIPEQAAEFERVNGEIDDWYARDYLHNYYYVFCTAHIDLAEVEPATKNWYRNNL